MYVCIYIYLFVLSVSELCVYVCIDIDVYANEGII